MNSEVNSTSLTVAARPLGAAHVTDDPLRGRVLFSNGYKWQARNNGHHDIPDTNYRTVAEAASPTHEGPTTDQRPLMAADLLAKQVLELTLRNPRRGRYVNALQALLAGESGDVGRIAFLTTSPVAKAGEQLRALAETGVASVRAGATALDLYTLAESSEE